jgi:eukaryotic-like serine/threonine-protein kinase
MDLSVLCLDDVAQNGSAAMDDDAALIRAIEGGSADGSLVGQEPADASLVERHGDAALVAFTLGPDDTPASVLLVKGEAGWRIRDYLGG